MPEINKNCEPNKKYKPYTGPLVGIPGLGRFLRLHFQTNEGFVGNVILFVRGQHKNHMKMVRYAHADELEEMLASLTFGEHDYYITQNTFTTGKRDKEHLFSLNNIVIDIDIHANEARGDNRKRALEVIGYQLVHELFEDPEFPTPNTLVFTGRGFQLWYAHTQLPAAAIKVRQAAYGWICGRVEAFIDSLSSAPAAAVVDKSVSSPAGLVRLPGSFNTKAGRMGEFWILNEEPMDLNEFCAGHGLMGGKTATKARVNFSKEASSTLAAIRARKLFHLQDLRKKDGAHMAGNETRDLFLFCLFCVLRQGTADTASIESVLRDMNSRFFQPMPEAEWSAYMSSCRSKHYLISNGKIIEKLSITEEEQAEIGLWPAREESRETQRGKKRAEKEERNGKILRAYQDGLSVKQAAGLAGCSEGTVRNVLKKNGLQADGEKRRSLLARLVEAGTPVKEAAAQVGLSVSAAYGYLRRRALASKPAPRVQRASVALTMRQVLGRVRSLLSWRCGRAHRGDGMPAAPGKQGRRVPADAQGSGRERRRDTQAIACACPGLAAGG